MGIYSDQRQEEDFKFYIGLAFAINSSLLIGSSFVIKKKGLLRLRRYGQKRAGSGGHGYLKDWVWWTGFLMMGLGELANFAAYAFVPASLVAPLGALSVLVGAVLSSKCLGEKLNLLGKVGCVLCILGAIVIIIHSPKERSVKTMTELSAHLSKPGFLCYLVFAIALSFILCFAYAPKHGSTNVMIYTGICSLSGSLNVMGAKGLGIGLRQTFEGASNELTNVLTWFLLLWVAVSVVFQMHFLNKALDSFSTAMVTPVYYVLFTGCTVLASALLLEEWEQISSTDVLGHVCGFLTVILGIFLLHSFKEMDLTLSTHHRTKDGHAGYTRD